MQYDGISRTACGVGMNFLKFFKKQEPQEPEQEEITPIYKEDTLDRIYLDATGDRFYELNSVSDEEIRSALEIIKNKLHYWMLLDISIAGSVNIKPLESFSVRLATIDLKYLPKTGNWSQLDSYIESNTAYQPASRLLDVITEISLEVSPKLLECLKGRFLYGMLYSLPLSLNEKAFPTKYEWLDALAQQPWIFYLPLIQEIYDTDHAIAKLTKVQALSAFSSTTANNPNRSITS